MRTTDHRKPTLFVGSSSEAKSLIPGLRLNLSDRVHVDSWAPARWPLSRSTLDGIEAHLRAADFAAFILTADDVALVRGELTRSPRDNVLLELGMSFGCLGRNRTFVIVPSGADEPTTPSDLDGITVIHCGTHGTPRDRMAVPADLLCEAMDEAGLKAPPPSFQSSSRGDTGRLDLVADAALHVFESRSKYVDELRGAVMQGERVPAKFQFAQPGGGRHWLQLCNRAEYGYFHHAKALLNGHKAELAALIFEAVGNTAIDFVSLGSGDGSKDDMLLRALTAQLGETDYLYYYPIDISDGLLVEAIRYIATHGLSRARFRCKPILGDFTKLSSLTALTAYRANPNVFSILGNAVGSFDEPNIISSIAGAMTPGDLVLIEAKIGGSGESTELLDTDAAGDWDQSTLDVLNIDRRSYELRKEEATNVSLVPGTRSLLTYAVPHKENRARYMISAMHHYSLEELRRFISSELQVAMIGEIVDGDVALLVGQRETVDPIRTGS
jgi:uncharacterized SAM-dependent methyltransferase